MLMHFSNKVERRREGMSQPIKGNREQSPDCWPSLIAAPLGEKSRKRGSSRDTVPAASEPLWELFVWLMVPWVTGGG